MSKEESQEILESYRAEIARLLLIRNAFDGIRKVALSGYRGPISVFDDDESSVVRGEHPDALMVIQDDDDDPMGFSLHFGGDVKISTRLETEEQRLYAHAAIERLIYGCMYMMLQAEEK